MPTQTIVSLKVTKAVVVEFSEKHHQINTQRHLKHLQNVQVRGEAAPGPVSTYKEIRTIIVLSVVN